MRGKLAERLIARMNVLADDQAEQLRSNHQRVVDCSLSMSFARHFWPPGEGGVRAEDKMPSPPKRVSLQGSPNR